VEDKLFWYKATCTRVVDGDTADFDIDCGLHVHVHERIRIHGINAPETYGVRKDSEEYALGKKATEFAKNLIEGKEVWINTVKDKTGKYGRYLATVWVKEEGPDGSYFDLGQALVDAGLAALDV